MFLLGLLQFLYQLLLHRLELSSLFQSLLALEFKLADYFVYVLGWTLQKLQHSFFFFCPLTLFTDKLSMLTHLCDLFNLLLCFHLFQPQFLLHHLVVVSYLPDTHIHNRLLSSLFLKLLLLLGLQLAFFQFKFFLLLDS